MPDIDLIIFDCDGVLIDSEVLTYQAWAECLAPLGTTLTVENLYSHMSHDEAKFLAAVKTRFDVSLPVGFIAAKNNRRMALFEENLRVIEGITILLDRLTVPHCVASGSSPPQLQHALQLTGLWDRFAPHIFSITQVERGKPAPDLFLFAAAQMQVEPTRCLVIEDSLSGVQAARAAGMEVWGFTGGNHCQPGHDAKLKAAEASLVFATMPALAAHLIKELAHAA